MGIRKHHSPSFKFKVALEALKGRPATEICQTYGIAPSLVHKWKKELQKTGSSVFEDKKIPAQEAWRRERSKLFEHIGELSTQLDFLKKVVDN